MADITSDDLNRRLFGPQPDQPLDLPGTSAHDRARFEGILRQDAPGSVEAIADMQRQLARLSPADRARAAALTAELAKLIRNTNITASQPAHAEPDIWSMPIDLSATVTVAAAVSAAYTTVIAYTVPSGFYARINGYGFDVDGGYAYDGSLLWRIQINGSNAPNLQPWAEHRGTVVQPRKTFLIVPQTQRVTFQVRRAVLAGAPSVVAMALTGWTWRLRRNDEGTKASITAF